MLCSFSWYDCGGDEKMINIKSNDKNSQYIKKEQKQKRIKKKNIMSLEKKNQN